MKRSNTKPVTTMLAGSELMQSAEIVRIYDPSGLLQEEQLQTELKEAGVSCCSSPKAGYLNYIIPYHKPCRMWKCIISTPAIVYNESKVC